MATTTCLSTIVDNESSNITYFPNGSNGLDSAWKFDRNVFSSQLYNNTESLSYQHNAYALLSFYGTGLEYWSNTNSDHGPRELMLDENLVGTVSSYSPQLGDPVVLYSVTNLQLGRHSFKVQVSSEMHPNGCEIDRFVVTAGSLSASGNIGSGNNCDCGWLQAASLISSFDSLKAFRVGSEIVVFTFIFISFVLMMLESFGFRRRSKPPSANQQQVQKSVKRAVSHIEKEDA